MKNANYLKNAKAVIAFFVVAISGSLFLLFYTNQDNILQSDNFFSFMTLVVIIMGFSLALLYMVNNDRNKSKAHAVVKSAKKHKKRSR